jgi:hypothetical protein
MVLRAIAAGLTVHALRPCVTRVFFRISSSVCFDAWCEIGGLEDTHHQHDSVFCTATTFKPIYAHIAALPARLLPAVDCVA